MISGTFDSEICRIVRDEPSPARRDKPLELFFHIDRVDPPHDLRDDFRLDILHWNNITLFELDGGVWRWVENFRTEKSRVTELVPKVITPLIRQMRRQETVRLRDAASDLAKRRAFACYR